jgi:hypothetical protein
MRLRFLVPTAVACLATGLLHCGPDMPAAAGKDAGKDAIALPEPDAGAAADASTELPPPPPPPPGCPGNVLPSENECMVHESYGVFVSASKGTPAGDGSRTSPLKSVSAAIAAAKSSGRRVYACAETYDEVLTLADGIAVFGYFDCGSSWKVGATRATIAPKTEGVAARAASIGKPTRIEGFEIKAADATTPGGSSIGLIAQDAGGLSFFDVSITAGAAMAGEDGVAAVQLTQAGNIDGEDGLGSTIGYLLNDGRNAAEYGRTRAGGVSQCVGVAGKNGGSGGAGGKNGRYSTINRVTGTPCVPSGDVSPCGYELYDTGARADGTPRPATTVSARGASPTEVALSGAAGTDGANGKSGNGGSFGSDGYQGMSGTQGTDGAPGQGGGGGSGVRPDTIVGDNQLRWGMVGAGGGAGGCPGLAGTPGKAGGASVAVVAIRSAMHFDAKSILTAQSGGTGGRGSAGSLPTPGGRPGFNPSGNAFSAGGFGAAGGLGGSSGHGSSGPSVGVAWTGAQPVVETTPTVAEAAPGRPEEDGVASSGPGVAEPFLRF